MTLRAAAGERRDSSATTRPSSFRPDIQSLRAVAILAVLLNHLWPARVTGGYVGVDIFFVISGFLISSHLFKEVTATGRLRLGRFYAKRVRRLLPAALFVLAAGAVATAIFLPYPRWNRAGSEIIASAAYFENWFLAAMSIDYSALNDSATVAQHYWSLSVEEQFYFVWPVLIVVASAVALRRGRSQRAGVVVMLTTLAVLSLASSVIFTALTPNPAYFVTYTRVWEFAIGGLVALLATQLRLQAAVTNALSAAGFTAIGISVFFFDDHTPFPGLWALVPVLGTAAVIIAGMDRQRQWHAPVTSSRPVQWLGGVSYSLYLWHWPLIVIVPFALTTALSTPLKIIILVASLGLAWATKKLVEDPGQKWPALVASSSRTFVAMAIGISVVALAGAGLVAAHAVRADADRPPTEAVTGSCVGPNALDSENECSDPFGPAIDAVMGPRNEYFYAPPECGPFEAILQYGDKKTTVRCDFSDGSASAEEVWLVGDSHAQQWQGAIFDLARQYGWKVTTSYLGGCPAVDVPFIGFRGPWSAAEATVCNQWSNDVSAKILDESPSIVFTSSAGRNQLVDDGSGRPQVDQFADGLGRSWQRWADAGSQVVALANVPYNAEVRPADCVLLNPSDPVVCARPSAEAQPPDPYLIAAERLKRADVIAIDFDRFFCPKGVCYAVIGGLPVFYDGDHLNLEYVRLLAPTVSSALQDASAFEG